MMKLAAALKLVTERGERVLLSINPSPWPASGQVDPMTEFLSPLGVSADSGRPLLQQFSQANGRLVSADLFTTDPKTTHAIASAMRGVVTRLPWGVPITQAPGGGAGFSPVLIVDDPSGNTWGESEWLEFRRVPPAERGRVANPPKKDQQGEGLSGPWVIVASVERVAKLAGGGEREQRLVLVGSNGWFLDDVAQGTGVVDGREVAFNPGNVELFDACVSWLAGDESAIGASALAQVESTIPNLTPAGMSVVRWGLIAGLPLLVLVFGGAWRLMRR
jgi:hypothetical protein